jgi:phage/plasmid primase-like uncharacterized protein
MSQFSRSDAEHQFRDHLHQCGLTTKEIWSDGHFHRCDVTHKGVNGVNDGSYVLHVHADYAHGGCINWTNGQGWQKWSFKRPGWKPTAEERKAMEREFEQARNEREREIAVAQRKARQKANDIWRVAQEAKKSFPYCQRKQVEPNGLKTHRHNNGDMYLCVPMHDEDEHLVSLQKIYANGDKRFLYGGRKQHHFWIGWREQAKVICICEGWATGETIYEATKYSVVIAFDSGNLMAIAQWVHERYPEHEIILCADDDWKNEGGNPGLDFACDAARAVNGKVAVPVFGEGREDKWTDFNDMLLVVDDRERVLDIIAHAIAAAVVPDEVKTDDGNGDSDGEGDSEGDDDDEPKSEKQKQSDLLVELAVKSAEFFHSEDGTAYADIKVGSHWETWAIDSQGFHRWLKRQYYEAGYGAPNAAAEKSALGVLTAKAQYDGDLHEVFLRVAEHDGRIYLDLCDDEWRVIEIDADGWGLCTQAPPVRFIRRRGMLALPVPVSGGSLDTLRKYINVRSAGDWVLLRAFLLAALRPRGPYPVLSVAGETGSAKTTLLKVLRRLIDPNKAAVRRNPREDRDLFISGKNCHLLIYDNLSDLKVWFSDSLSSIATEGSFGTRELYTNDEECLLTVMRPIIIGAIDDIIMKGDLADRTVALLLTPITGRKRVWEDEFWQAFERDCPSILGALLDALSHGLRQLAATRRQLTDADKPRMADFYLWATACGDGLLWKRGEFAAAYEDNRAKVNKIVVEGDSLTAAIKRLMEIDEGEWEGTATLLKDRLDGIAGESETRRWHWPSSASTLGRRMRSLATPLRRLGIEIDWRREGRKQERIFIITDTTVADRADSTDSSSRTSRSTDQGRSYSARAAQQRER